MKIEKKYTIEESAKLMGIHIQSLYRKIREKTGPDVVKVDSRLYIKEKELELYLNGE